MPIRMNALIRLWLIIHTMLLLLVKATFSPIYIYVTDPP